jgi:hypothetical protein
MDIGLTSLKENVNHVTKLVLLALPDIPTDVSLVQPEDGITKEDVLKFAQLPTTPKNTQESVLLVFPHP